MRWNGASPNTSSISVYANQGTTYVTAGVASDIGDGGQCVKIESDGTSRGRANLMVTVPSSVTGQMTYGKEYVLSAWVYRSGSATTDATAQLRANGQNENTVADSIQIVQPAEILPASSTTTGWYKMEVPFKYMGKTLKFEVGIYNGPTTGGYLLIDNLQLAQKGILHRQN